MAGLDVSDFPTRREQLTAFAANRASEYATSPVDFLGELIGVLSLAFNQQDQTLSRYSLDAVPTAESSTTGHDTWAVALGLDAGLSAGSYGRRGATAAQGATGQITGQGSTLVPSGTQATAGGVTIALRANATTSAGATGQVIGTFDAVTTGAASTLAAGTRCTWISPPPGIDSEFTLVTPMAVAGQDQENNASLLLRIQLKMQRPPNGGNGTDYAQWATGAKDSVGNAVTTTTVYAYVYPHYYGVGSPMVCAVFAGSGRSRIPGQLVLDAIAEYINGTVLRTGQRPVSHDCTVLPPYMPTSRALVTRVRCIPSLAKFAMDWQRGVTVYTVNDWANTGLASWITDPPVSGNLYIELNTLAPASLKDAVNAGALPRLYVHMTDGAGTPRGPVIPEQGQVAAYQDVAGKTRLALRVPTVDNWPISIGDQVYAGGPIVAPVASAILVALDTRGPSRISGLADPAVLWQDTVSPSVLSTAAETTVDTDGVTRLVDRCVANGVTIGIGSGALSAQEVRATDDTVNGPELLYAGRVLVTD